MGKRSVNSIDFEYSVCLPLFDEFASHYINGKYKRINLGDFPRGEFSRGLERLIERVNLLLKFEYLFSPRITLDPNWMFNNVPLVISYCNGQDGIRDIFRDNFFSIMVEEKEQEIFGRFLEERYPEDIESTPIERNSSAWQGMYRASKETFYEVPRNYLKKFVKGAVPTLTDDHFRLVSELPGKAAANVIKYRLEDFDIFSKEASIYYPDLFGTDANKAAMQSLFKHIKDYNYLKMSKIRDKKHGLLKEVNKEFGTELTDYQVSWFFRQGFYLPAHAKSGNGIAVYEAFRKGDLFNHGLFSIKQAPEKEIPHHVSDDFLEIAGRKYQKMKGDDSILKCLSRLTFQDIRAIRERKYWKEYREGLRVMSRKAYHTKKEDLANQQFDLLCELIGELIMDSGQLADNRNTFFKSGGGSSTVKVTFFVIGEIITFAVSVIGGENYLIPAFMKTHARKALVTRPLGKYIISHQVGATM